MQKISLKELDGYREDAQCWERFIRPYSILRKVGLGIFVVGVIWGLSHRPGVAVWLTPITTILAGLGILLGAFAVSVLAAPRCPGESKSMKRYWNSEPRSGEAEVLYVDANQKVFCRRTVTLVAR